MKKFVLLLVIPAFFIVFGIHAQAVIADNHLTLQGIVTFNTDPAPLGVTIEATLEVLEPQNIAAQASVIPPLICGTSTTGNDGSYTLVVASECTEGELKFVVAATNIGAVTIVPIIGTDKVREVAIAFENISSETLITIGGIAPPSPEGELANVLQGVLRDGPNDPLVEDTNLLILLSGVVGGGLFLLLAMVFVRFWVDRQRVELGEKIVDAIKDRGGDDGQRSRAARDGNQQSVDALIKVLDVQPDAGSYRRQIEGMVMVLVIVAIILLGVTEKIGDQGLVSVLAAIVGYAVGRASSSS